MTNKKGTKKALVMSALSLLLCISMLVGSTFAWFTDSVTSGSNVITSGNLDIEVQYSFDGETWKDLAGATDLFSKGLWEPGHTEVVYLKVKNAGTLALKYNLGVNIDSETVSVNVAGDPFKLSDYILYDVREGTPKYADSAAAREDETGTQLKTPYNNADELEAGEEVYLTMVVFMPTTVGNEANYDKNYDIPVINLGVNVFATQYTFENDSFGPNYDADAKPVIVYTAEELAAELTSGDEYISVVLANDIDLPISSLGTITGGSGEYKLGGENTKAITIDLGGNKLNITTTYWSNLGAKNDAAVFTIKNGSMTSSQPTGTWNSYDLTFSNCKYVFENVAFEKAVALETDAVLKNVTINETHDYYALWITAKGQTVEIDGLVVNSLGRGIKIDEQYVDAPEKVTLKVSNAAINTVKKGAIMVKSAAGADIALSNVDISNTIDIIHEVWVDEDAVAYYDLVTVTGGEKIAEGEIVNATANLQAALDAAEEGAVIELVPGARYDSVVMKAGSKNVTIKGAEAAVVGSINLNGSNGTTLSGITFDAAGAAASYDGRGTLRAYACVFGASKNGKIGARNLVIEDCTFIGTFADVNYTKAAIAFTDRNRTTGGSGDVTVKGCTFNTANAQYDVYAYYTAAVNEAADEFTFQGNTFKSVTQGSTIWMGRLQGHVTVNLTGNAFEAKANFEVAQYAAPDGNWTVNVVDGGNTFAN